MTAGGARYVVISSVHVLPPFFEPRFKSLEIANIFASIEANCPSSRASERALRSVGARSRFAMSSSKTNQALAVERMPTSLTLNDKTTESHAKPTCSDIAKLLVSIGDQFKKELENVVTNTDTLQIGEDLEELSLVIPEGNAQEVYGAGIEYSEGVWATHTSVTQWLDSLYYLTVSRRNT